MRGGRLVAGKAGKGFGARVAAGGLGARNLGSVSF